MTSNQDLLLLENDNIIPFPSDFIFGTAIAAYQIEGAYNDDGRGMSIWDEFSHTPGKTANGDTGDVADDHYHKVRQDVDLLYDLGIKNYRMSISWTRILPNGLLSGGVNQQGIDHYNMEINYLISKGINVMITLFHWDYPQYLEPCQVVITLNEPWVVAWLGYGVGVNAPGIRTPDKSENNDSSVNSRTYGNSSTEPYLAAHHQLLAHAHAVKIYRSKYQSIQQGKIGIALNSNYNEPLNENDPLDIEAAERQQLFDLGWFADPIVFGDYPQVMKDLVGKERLPEFTIEEQHILAKSFDFIGLNHYTSRYVSH